MSSFDWTVILLSVVTGLLIPALVFLLRAAIKWARVEDRLGGISDDLKEIVADKNRTHSEMLAQMREDRAVTDRRLRWLEENLWRGPASSSTRRPPG